VFGRQNKNFLVRLRHFESSNFVVIIDFSSFDANFVSIKWLRKSLVFSLLLRQRSFTIISPIFRRSRAIRIKQCRWTTVLSATKTTFGQQLYIVRHLELDFANCSRDGNFRPRIVLIGSNDFSRRRLSSRKATTTWSGVDFFAANKSKAIALQKSQKATDSRCIYDRHETRQKRWDSIGRTRFWLDWSSK
jgi:hypothetical protein